MAVFAAVAVALLQARPEDRTGNLKEIDELIRRLGDDEFEVREAAQEKLIRKGPGALLRVAQALEQARDPEMRSRLNEILKRFGDRGEYARILARADTAVLDLHPDGAVKHGDKLLCPPTGKAPKNEEALAALFRERAKDTDPGLVLLRFPGDLPFELLNRVLRAGAAHGPVSLAQVRDGRLIRLLRDPFPEERGETSGERPELNAVYVYLCSDLDRSLAQHIGHRRNHKAAIEKQKAGGPVGQKTHCWVELDFKKCYTLFGTHEQPEKAPHNRQVYDTVADRIQALLADVRSSRDPARPAPTVLDPDGPVPAEHILGILQSLRARGIREILLPDSPILADTILPPREEQRESARSGDKPRGTELDQLRDKPFKGAPRDEKRSRK